MKMMKKMAGIALALVMALALMAPAFAAEGGNTITVNNAAKGETYTLYKIFDAKVIEGRESDADGITYSFSGDLPDSLAEVFEKDAANDTIKVKDDVSDTNIMAAVKAYAATAAEVTHVTADGSVVKFTGLGDGYYAVISTVSEGNMVTITSVAPNAEVYDKNTAEMTVSKKLSDAEGTALEDHSVTIGQTVYYNVSVQTVNWVDEDDDDTNGAEAKIESYTVSDPEETFLTGLKIHSIKVTEPADADGNKEVHTIATPDNAVTVTIPWTDNGNHLYPSGSTITVIYTATVNANTVVGGDANTNTAYVTYNDGQTVGNASDSVYSYQFGLVKTKDDSTVLKGAEFELYNGNGEDAAQIKVVKKEDGVYRVAMADETGVAIEVGEAQIQGLANGTYYLKETVAPDGYNAVDGYTDGVTINNGDNLAKVEGGKWTEGGIHVVNLTGALLPSTGGIGTTIFYIGGGILVVGAAILLITKKRMGSAD